MSYSKIVQVPREILQQDNLLKCDYCGRNVSRGVGVVGGEQHKSDCPELIKTLADLIADAPDDLVQTFTLQIGTIRHLLKRGSAFYMRVESDGQAVEIGAPDWEHFCAMHDTPPKLLSEAVVEPNPNVVRLGIELCLVCGRTLRNHPGCEPCTPKIASPRNSGLES